MTNDHDDKNVMLYMLAGVGLGALIGAAAGLLFAPKPGVETRAEIASKFKEIKGRTEDWMSERRARKGSKSDAEDPAEQVGA
ncbi:MAG: YtxH domain-containing protein [Fimbriimonadaceae bacterium]